MAPINEETSDILPVVYDGDSHTRGNPARCRAGFRTVSYFRASTGSQRNP